MSAAPLPGPRFHTSSGVPVYLEPSDELPLVDIEIICREGTVVDPRGRDGLTRLTAQMIRRGPRGMSTEAFDEAVEGLGATIGASVSSHAVRFHGSVIRRNLGPYLSLVGRMLTSPAFRARDLARQMRKNEAELVELRDHDRALAGRAFRRQLFGDHPYGRPATGSLETLATLGRRDVEDRYARLVTTGNLLIGVAGDVTEADLAPLLDKTFRHLPEGPEAKVAVPAPKLARGRRVLLVDKPQRTQTQVYVGTLGAKLPEPSYHALLAANTAFGGTFTSRLVQQVRVERGWSYGAGSKLGADRQREAWTMWTHPAAEQVLDCLRLELELLDAWIERGTEPDELGRAKDYLIKSHAFDLETAAKRLEPQLETALYRLPKRWYPEFVERIRAVTPEAAAAAVRRRISGRDQTIALVATATDTLLAGLEALPGVRTVQRVSVADV